MKLGAPAPINPANIARPVPLVEASPERQAVYKPLTDVRLKERGETAGPDPVPEVVEQVQPWEPTAEDKKNFMRALLGARQYEKTYTLFNGAVKVTFLDRTAKQAETLYQTLRNDHEMQLFPEADLDLWEARYHFAATLRKLELNDRAPVDFDFPEKFHERVVELMENNSSPLYQALMSVSDTFERHLSTLIANARNESFWQTGGTASR